MACRVLLKIVYLLTCRIPGVAVLVFPGDRAKAAELLVLRHENAVLRRHIGRVRYEPTDRVWFAALARLLPRRRWTEIFLVAPATLQHDPAASGHRPARPYAERDIYPATVTDVDIRQIHRKPVLNGLINEYVHAT